VVGKSRSPERDMMTKLTAKSITIEPGQIAILVSHEDKSTEDERVQYMVYDNTESSPDNILPFLVRGVCYIASNDPDRIIEAYREAEAADKAQPEWAHDTEGSA